MINSKAAQAICLIAFTFAVMALAPCPAQWEGREEILADVEKTFGDPPGMVRLDRKGRVWADKKNRRVAVDGYIALRAGQLEMLACLVGTKEHESIFAVFSDAQSVHAGLLAVGAKQGEPVKWDPVYQPPTGSPVQVTVLWKDANGQKRSADAHLGTQNGRPRKNVGCTLRVCRQSHVEGSRHGRREILGRGWRPDLCIEFFNGHTGRSHG